MSYIRKLKSGKWQVCIRRKNYPTITKTFNGKIDSDSIKNWHDLKLQWEEIIKTTADSYLKGECAVQFNEKTDFTYCQILPLLRLPEKKYQFEKL